MNNFIFFKKEFWMITVSSIACFVSLFTFFTFVYQTNTVLASDQNNFYSIEQLNVIINKERIARNLEPLKINNKLNVAAKNKAEDMSKHSYFSHISSIDGKKWSDFISQTGYQYSEAGENLANGFDSPSEMITAWMKSPSHRENILNKDVNDTGIGYTYGKLGGVPTIFVVQLFGKLETSV